MQMKDRAFIDSNIFLYAFSNKDKSKQTISAEIIQQNNIISVQIINEVSNNMLKKLNFSNQEIQKFIVNCYNKYEVVNLSKNILINSAKLRDNHKLSYYDSLILSTAIYSDCDVLYSEDMQHNQKIENLTIINPFK
jgi:predicted nucleic acid-binding protein